MYGLKDLVCDYGLSETKKTLFTYFGEGNIFIMISDSSNIEAMLMEIASDILGLHLHLTK